MKVNSHFTRLLAYFTSSKVMTTKNQLDMLLWYKYGTDNSIFDIGYIDIFITYIPDFVAPSGLIVFCFFIEFLLSSWIE